MTLLSMHAFAAEPPLRVAIAGLVHGHVSGFLKAAEQRPDIRIAALFDPDPILLARYGETFHVPPASRFTTLAAMLAASKPEVVATFTSTAGHRAVVEQCAARQIAVMMEKPLATTSADALAIARAAQAATIPVIVNYETTWYRSHGEIWNLTNRRHALGSIRKMVAMDGHQGPQEIHVQPEFFRWLTDPVQNGAGALFDFGCYGANLMTWLMENQKPTRVTALTQTNKPAIYKNVDDEATVLLEYPSAQGIIQGSWNWPFSRKDFEVYGQSGYAIATGGKNLRVRTGPSETAGAPPDLPPGTQDPLSYLIRTVRGRQPVTGLSSLENNVIVVQILQAAHESARTGRTQLLN